MQLAISVKTLDKMLLRLLMIIYKKGITYFFKIFSYIAIK